MFSFVVAGTIDSGRVQRLSRPDFGTAKASPTPYSLNPDRDSAANFLYNATYPEQFDPKEEGMTMFIRDVIRDREPYSLRTSATVLDAARFMSERRIGAVCVLDEDGKLIGVFSERDLLNRVVVPRSDPATLELGQVASPVRAVISCDETPHQALDRMEEIGSRHLPVVDGEKWVGMLSMRDLLRVEVNEQGDELRLLHDYIRQ